MTRHVPRASRLASTLAIAGAVALGLAAPAWTSQSQHLTIGTSKAPGPVAGTFSATGAITDSGAINNLTFLPSAHGAPTFGVSHITILFSGSDGTFTVKAQIVETLTADPNVLTDSGTWTIIDGTGAYAGLHGVGTVTGSVNDNVNLITRTFDGDVHFD